MLGVCSDFEKFAAWRRHELHRNQMSPVRIRPPAKAGVAQWIEHWTVSGREFPPQKETGMAQSRDTSMTNDGGAVSSAAVLIFSSRFEFVVALWKASGLKA